MAKPLKLPKNSFIFLETIFAVVVLSLVMSGFFKLTFNKEDIRYSLQLIYNQFIEKNYDNHFSSKQESLHLKKDNDSVYVLPTHKIIFENQHIKLIQYEL